MRKKKVIKVITIGSLALLLIAIILHIHIEKRRRAEEDNFSTEVREMTQKEKEIYEENYKIIAKASNSDIANEINRLLFLFYCNERTESMEVLEALPFDKIHEDYQGKRSSDHYIIVILKDGDVLFCETYYNEIICIYEKEIGGKALFFVIE